MSCGSRAHIVKNQRSPRRLQTLAAARRPKSGCRRRSRTPSMPALTAATTPGALSSMTRHCARRGAHLARRVQKQIGMRLAARRHGRRKKLRLEQAAVAGDRQRQANPLGRAGRRDANPRSPVRRPPAGRPLCPSARARNASGFRAPDRFGKSAGSAPLEVLFGSLDASCRALKPRNRSSACAWVSRQAGGAEGAARLPQRDQLAVDENAVAIEYDDFRPAHDIASPTGAAGSRGTVAHVSMTHFQKQTTARTWSNARRRVAQREDRSRICRRSFGLA